MLHVFRLQYLAHPRRQETINSSDPAIKPEYELPALNWHAASALQPLDRSGA
jgi:hypothetical protein